MPYGGSPATVATDELKLLIGDLSTSSSGQLLSTGECAYFISSYGTPRAAAPHACRAIAAMFADEVSKSVGDLRLDAQQKFEHYTTLATSLQAQASYTGIPYAGGISRGDKQSVEQNTDRVAPAFKVGLHDNPLSGSTST